MTPIVLTASDLSWGEARSLALSGQFVRRATWTTPPDPLVVSGGVVDYLYPAIRTWFVYKSALWYAFDQNKLRSWVVTEADFDREDELANDWTTDPVGTAVDVCTRTPPKQIFVPPSASVRIDPAVGIIVTLGPSNPSGSYQLRAYLNGSAVAFVEATDNSTTIIPCSIPVGSGTVYANVGIVSRPPLPFWTDIQVAQCADPSVPPAFVPTLIYSASYPYNASNAGNYYLPDGITPAGRVPNSGDNVQLNSHIYAGAMTAHMVFMSAGTVIGNWPPPSIVTCLGGLIMSAGCQIQSIPSIVGPVYLVGSGARIGGSGVDTTITGNVYLSAGSFLNRGVIVNGDVVATDAMIQYTSTINGNLFLIGSSYHDPGYSGAILTINGNLDVYAPATYPVPYVSVSGATTYHP